jgi:hypothetical protein
MHAEASRLFTEGHPMSQALLRQLGEVLEQIDRPGSFCASGSVPVVLPGLEVEGLGPVGLPLTEGQAKELRKHCQQAPYGKGEQTLIDTSVRRVWRLQPDRFALTNPDWELLVQQVVHKVQEELGLEKQKLESHLYDLLLYEPGSFFLPHRDGEKLDRMVATLVIVLPSAFEGGELVVRHDGEERTLDFGGADRTFRIHFAAFYADCEHEIRPLRAGYRLCLIYNLTLAKAKKPIAAPSFSGQTETIARLLREWAESGAPHKLAVTLAHKYTADGLSWDALKGVDRSKARSLLEGARRAGCQAHLALLTLHESGSAEYASGGGYRGRRYHDEDDPNLYEMGEIYDTSLIAEHLSDPEGKPLPVGPLPFTEDELLDPEALQDIDPEEQVEGYTGNEGMTYDRWYRHGAIVLWPNRKQFDVLCDAGSSSAVNALGQHVERWRRAGKKEAAALRTECLDFAATIIARWQVGSYLRIPFGTDQPANLFSLLAPLDEPRLISAYLSDVLTKDAAADPGPTLATVCREQGWETFRPQLESAFKGTTAETLERNVRLLEHICLARTRKDNSWLELCRSLARLLVSALETIDQQRAEYDWRAQRVKRADVLAGLARALLASEQDEMLSRVADHALARPEKYPLTDAHVAALTDLGPWLAKNIKAACPGLRHWLDSCIAQLEALTAEEPQPPADFRRTATISCKYADCAELKSFLQDPSEPVHRFRAVEARRRHLADVIGHSECDLDLSTERRGSPHTLVCTKNRASYERELQTFHANQEHLATLRTIQKKLPK